MAWDATYSAHAKLQSSPGPQWNHRDASFLGSAGASEENSPSGLFDRSRFDGRRHDALPRGGVSFLDDQEVKPGTAFPTQQSGWFNDATKRESVALRGKQYHDASETNESDSFGVDVLIKKQDDLFPIIYQELFDFEDKTDLIRENWITLVFPINYKRELREHADFHLKKLLAHYSKPGNDWEAILDVIVELCLGETRRKLSDVFSIPEHIEHIKGFVSFWKSVFEAAAFMFPYWFISKVAMFDFLVKANSLTQDTYARQASSNPTVGRRHRVRFDSPDFRSAGNSLGNPQRLAFSPEGKDDDQDLKAVLEASWRDAERERILSQTASVASLQFKPSATNSAGLRPSARPAANPPRQQHEVNFRVVESDDEDEEAQPKSIEASSSGQFETKASQFRPATEASLRPSATNSAGLRPSARPAANPPRQQHEVNFRVVESDDEDEEAQPKSIEASSSGQFETKASQFRPATEASLRPSATNSAVLRPSARPAAEPPRQQHEVNFRVEESDDEDEEVAKPKKPSYFSWLRRGGGMRQTRRKRRKAVNRMRTRQILNHLY